MKQSKYIDHTLLKADASKIQIINLCNEAVTYDFYSVCVNSVNVKLAKNTLKNTNIKVCSVIGFPLGAVSIKVKAIECKQALKDGADEIDLLINIGKLKDDDFIYLEKEIMKIRKIVKNKILKVIIETCYLNEKEIIKICRLLSKCKVDYVKTSTGFGTSGASSENINLIKNNISKDMFIKASGGIGDLKSFKTYLKMGVNRIGTSKGVKIIKEVDENNEKK